jgi:eukaryotic-like serine/threonine-protein kinase
MMTDIPGFTLNAKLAEGGCAEIYAAVDQSSGKLVCIKILSARNVGNAAEIKRLVNEGALGLKLGQHDNIVQTLKSGTVGRMPYVVLEYIKGRTLRDVLRERKQFNDLEVLKLAKGMCRALRFLHNAGILHKDIKPENIMITNEGMFKLVDFGFAENYKAFSLFSKKTLEGSPAYMAPELLTTKKASIQTDIYALGCTLFEAATGNPPFTGMSHSQVIGLQTDLNRSAASVKQINRVISVATEKTILTACQKDIGRRFKSVDEILLDLARNTGWHNAKDSQRIAVGAAS